MPNPDVKKKLRSEILPYTVSARGLRKQWFYRMHDLFGYTTDAVVALSAIGITAPWLAFLARTIASDPAMATDGTSSSGALTGIPAWLYAPALAFVVAWVILRVGFHREEGQKRAVLARSCMRTMTQAEARLYRVLPKVDPMPDLTALVDEVIAPTIDRNIQEQAWPWPGPDPDPAVDDEVDRQLRALCMKFEENWAPGPADGIAPGGPDE